ncbi:hypothetical protein AZ19_2559, partial [Bordetella bronchiseptica E012]
MQVRLVNGCAQGHEECLIQLLGCQRPAMITARAIARRTCSVPRHDASCRPAGLHRGRHPAHHHPRPGHRPGAAHRGDRRAAPRAAGRPAPTPCCWCRRHEAARRPLPLPTRTARSISVPTAIDWPPTAMGSGAWWARRRRRRPSPRRSPVPSPV